METVITYGMTSSPVSREYPDEYTVGMLLKDRMVLGALGAPEGVKAVSNGVTLGNHEQVNRYREISLEAQASSKAG